MHRGRLDSEGHLRQRRDASEVHRHAVDRELADLPALGLARAARPGGLYLLLRVGLGRPQIALPDLVGLRELLGAALERDPSHLEHVGAVRDLQRAGHVLLDQDQCGALPVDLPQGLADPRHELRREAERRLVEQQQLRLAHERPPDGQHLLLAPRQQRAALGAPLLQAREQLVDARAGPGARGAVADGQGARAQVLVDREVSEDPPPLRDLHYPHPDDLGRVQRPRRRPSNSIEPASTAPPWSPSARDRPQERALPGAVGPQHGDNRAGRHRHADPVQGLHRPRVAHGQVVDVQQCPAQRW